jgi:hypothetical protein
MRIRFEEADAEVEVTSGDGLVRFTITTGGIRIRASVQPEDARRIADLFLDAARSAHVPETT